MEDTSGFYKQLENEWWYAPNFVYHRDYTLDRNNNRENVDGWQWHDEPPKEYLEWLEKQNSDTIP